MITGRVTASREAIIELVVRGPTGKQRPVTLVIDTGYDGHIALPASLVAELGLASHGQATAVFGDGSSRTLNKFQAAVLWDGAWRDVIILEADGGMVVGMALLDRSRLTIEVYDGGRVFVDALP